MEGFIRKARDLFKDYFSLVGLKVAFPVWLMISFSAVVYEFYVYRDDPGQAVERIVSPVFWVVPLLSFFVLQFILSKVIVLPIKRFEVYLRALERGERRQPFILKRRDELGYLTKRFNSLYEAVERTMETKDMHLSTLSSFTDAAGNIFDIPALMSHFFNTLKEVFDFEVGAYLLSHKGHIDGKIYSTTHLGEEGAKEVSRTLLKKVSEYCPDFPVSTIEGLEVSTLGQRTGPPHGRRPDPLVFPILCWGRPVGVILLFSFPGETPSTDILNPLIRHTSVVLERLLYHRSLEEKRLSQILSSMVEGVYMMDNYGHVTVLNRKGLELLSSFCRYSVECLGKDFGMAQCPHTLELTCGIGKFINRIRMEHPDLGRRIYREEITNEEGLVLEAYVSALLTEEDRKEGYVIVVRDVTQEREIQRRLMISSRLIALGEMAAGIAHEINNPLQVVLGNAEILGLHLEDEEGRARLDQIKEGAVRIKKIVRDLLIFAKEKVGEEEVDVNAVVHKGVKLVEKQLNLLHIDVELHLHPSPLIVKGNSVMLQQVIINLLNNAKDAIEESGQGGRVLVKTSRTTTDAVIEVTDDGPGIPEDVRDRIFDLFFTTKDVGKGTGLGLSISRKMVEGMRGRISVSSRPGEGATFRIVLPLHEVRRSSDGLEGLSLRDDQGSSITGKSVLIIDDEEGIVELIREIIEPMVPSIEVACNGKEGLDRIRERDYDLILLDMRMPDMDGRQLYKEIKASKPYLADRIVFITGDTLNEATRAFFALTGCRYIPKPFTLKELRSIILEELGEGSSEKG